MAVFVLDKHHKPLMPCSEERARNLLKRRRARVHKLHPFTIRLVDRLVENSVVDGAFVKIDPGSKETGRLTSANPARKRKSFASSNSNIVET